MRSNAMANQTNPPASENLIPNIAQLGAPDYRLKSRGSRKNIPGRFEKNLSFYDPELNGPDNTIDTDKNKAPLKTQVTFETARSIIARNQSPDVPFNQSINPYRGCEHGCIYCFARPSHSYLDLSPGLDFETRLVVKENAPQLLVRELSRPAYRCEPMAIGMNTDAYQPIEKDYRITRRLLEICLAFRQPVTIVTKGALLSRDMDLLKALNKHRLVAIAISLTTLNNELKSVMEPRAAGVSTRLQLISELVANKIPVSVLMAPIIPRINDHEIESVLKKVSDLGVSRAGYVLLRLPHELTDLFSDWLAQHFPLKAEAVLNTMKACHNGELYRSDFGTRQRGTGQYAELIAQRFKVASNRNGLNQLKSQPLRTSHFRVPKDLQPLLELMDWQQQRSEQKSASGEQLNLF